MANATVDPAVGTTGTDEWAPGRDLWNFLLDVGRAKLVDGGDDVEAVNDYTDVRTGQTGQGGVATAGMLGSPLVLLALGAAVVYALTR